MPNKMLIDASHPEETRVVVVHGNRIEEFDFESQDKKQLKGNIYLARVTRVEPSLQAAFVEYGGNRHGFLAFSEIHPDYYQIPVADRQALLRAEAEAAEEENDEDAEGEDRHDRNRGRRRRRGGKNRDRGGEARAAAESADDGFGAGDDNSDDDESAAAGQDAGGAETEVSEISPDAVLDDATNISMAATADAHVVSEEISKSSLTENDRGGVLEDVSTSNGDEHEVESVGAEDALEEVRNRRKPVRRHYKIQEVIKRRQILLVQVVKEERGNKGAALTTYLSLAGRYSVLMPNTARGGGISRKITNVQDRKRLKEVVQDLDVPQGMGVILRTAGESRTKAEIKRDYEYLMRLWETVRTLTLQSTAPALVYEEGSLIKRSVRDLYNKDIDEVLVSGEDGYREAKDFMRMLMPSHAKVVQPYRDTTPIFVRNGIEAQLDRMLQPQVTLKSGGYIIINQTEALVAIDVNSGRSTKEHSIEETALHTNLEAAEEVARQLRLRDLAGLIVIDFIDMEENRNNRAVEKRLKDCLKNDRARIQVGRISHFGLMEMSRQRIRASVLESTMKPCPHCGGTGHVRSESSVALLVVRAIEEFLIKDPRNHISVRTPTSTALYVLNHKRSTLAELEARFGLTITIEMDDTVGAQHYAIFRGAVAEKPVGGPIPLLAPTYDEPEDEIVEEEEEEVAETAAEERPAQPAQRAETGEQRDRKRRKRRRRRGGKDRDRDAAMPAEGGPTEGVAAADADDQHRADEGEVAEPAAATDESGEDVDRKKRRRGKRGGKRNRRDEEGMESPESATPAEAAPAEALAAQVVEDAPVVAAPLGEETAPAGEEPKKAPRRAARPKKVKAEEIAEQVEQPAVEPEPVAVQPEEKPKKPRASRRKVAEPALETPAAEAPQSPARTPKAPAVKLVSSTPEGETTESTEEKPKKAGWWQRKSFF
ncbi:ribonuclease E/G [Mesorhizobium sp. AaZ16]|uniref:ribonuclease E/G n=1 Tax=Mesorhizobium sp. AaZ16 TaxID=3402289 RepID=UPI00374F84AB